MTGCVIVAKKKIISTGCSHSSSFRLSQLHSIHAELHALLRGRHSNLRNATAYIGTKARKSGNIVNSAPCLACAIALRAAGVMDVYYTVSKGNMEYMSLEDELIFSGLKVYPKREDVHVAVP
jgi:deoxycytidylate deaminase